jgi:PHP family Zn ribbon phosphoesterase
MALADRTVPCFSDQSPHVYSLIPLPELLGELLGKGSATKAVSAVYQCLINRFGSELNLLLTASIEEISDVSPLLGEAIRRMRHGAVERVSGYDGEYGSITVFSAGEQLRLGLDPGLLRQG